MDVNVIGVVRVIKVFLLFLCGGEGCVINVVSLVGEK